MRGTIAWNVRVVVPAQGVRSAVQPVMSDPPTSLCVAVGLADPCVDTDAHGTDECRLADVGSESRPEVVVDVRATMKRACVQCEPVPHDGEERNEKGDAHHESDAKSSEDDSPRVAAANNLGIDACHGAPIGLR